MLDVALTIWSWAAIIAGAIIVFSMGVLIGVIILIALCGLVTCVVTWMDRKLDEFRERRMKRRLEKEAR